MIRRTMISWMLTPVLEMAWMKQRAFIHGVTLRILLHCSASAACCCRDIGFPTCTCGSIGGLLTVHPLGLDFVHHIAKDLHICARMHEMLLQVACIRTYNIGIRQYNGWHTCSKAFNMFVSQHSGSLRYMCHCIADLHLCCHATSSMLPAIAPSQLGSWSIKRLYRLFRRTQPLHLTRGCCAACSPTLHALVISCAPQIVLDASNHDGSGCATLLASLK